MLAWSRAAAAEASSGSRLREGPQVSQHGADRVMRRGLLGVVKPLQRETQPGRYRADICQQQSLLLQRLDFTGVQVQRLQLAHLVAEQFLPGLAVALAVPECLSLRFQRVPGAMCSGNLCEPGLHVRRGHR